MPTFRKGLAAIENAATQTSGDKGNFRPFMPEIRWRDDMEEKFILMVTPFENIYTVQLHEWVPVGEGEGRKGKYTRYEQFISRKDTGIGEDYDDIEDRLGVAPKLRSLGVAVELEPIMEEVQGRQRPKAFTVKVETYQTREGEEKIAPVIGVVNQGLKNFWGWLAGFDNTRAPVSETPMSVIRRGEGVDTAYDFFPFSEVDVDFGALTDNIQNVGYMAQEEGVHGLEPTHENAIKIGCAMMDKRIDELSDPDRYKELVDPIEEFNPRFGGKSERPKAESNGSSEKTAPTPSVPADKQDAFNKLRAKVEAKSE